MIKIHERQKESRIYILTHYSEHFMADLTLAQ